MCECRWLSKPTKRFFFAHADKVSEKWIKIVYNKYALKYTNKLRKRCNLEKLNDFDKAKYNTIPGLLIFLHELDYKFDKAKGLAHGKVREYWLRRGPRLLIILIAVIIFTILLAEYLTDVTKDEHIYSLLIGINMILFNIYMLYQKLIDSISSSIMRVGHDHYKNWKDNLADLKVTSL